MAGIYVHIPFCRQACVYCNFHFSTSLRKKAALLHALKMEMQLRKGFLHEPAHTLYFGGGTPSMLDGTEIEQLISSVKQHFRISPDCEITLEANPDDVSPGVLEKWGKAGINRISLGIQTFNEQELAWMNRGHTARQSFRAIDAILRSGIHNLSVDLIYGSPLSSNEDLVNNVNAVIERNIPHVSCYALTVEPDTMLNKMIRLNRSPAVNDDYQAEQFEMLVNMLERAGYEQYEISNFSKPGFRSRHNSGYWKYSSYIGIGPSAHSYDGHRRRLWNISNNDRYISGIMTGANIHTEEFLTDSQQLNEFIMMSLRTAEGLSFEKISASYGDGHARKIREGAAVFVSAGSAFITNDHLVLTRKGKFLADGIASALFV